MFLSVQSIVIRTQRNVCAQKFIRTNLPQILDLDKPDIELVGKAF